MQLTLELRGDVVDRQELLNGTQTVTLEGASDDGRWTASALVSWNLGLEAASPEGDLTLVRDDGAEIYGAVCGLARESSTAPTESGDERLTLQWELDGGAGEYDGATGTASGGLRIAGVEFTLALIVNIDV